MGPRKPGGRAGLRPLRLDVSGPTDLHQLLLRRADGRYLVALWRTASVWDPARKRALRVAPLSVSVAVPAAKRIRRASPVRSALLRPQRVRRGQVRLRLGGDPVLLEVTPRR
jgi:hypothetical protein